MISVGSFENPCSPVHKHSTVIETYYGIGCLLFRNRGAKIHKTFFIGSKQNVI
jgi:hypothetical protein